MKILASRLFMLRLQYALMSGLLGLLISGWPSLAEAQLVRVNNTTIPLPQNPPSIIGFTTVNALGNLVFNGPVHVATVPGDPSRLFVVERGGTVQVVTQLSGNPVKSTFLNLAQVQGVSGFTTTGECGLLGLAFHPNHLSNGEFFIFYSFGAPGLRQRVARMKVLPGQPNLADPSSLVPMITQPDQASNHNGGTLAFGADGYLYISLGDEGGANDVYNNARFINRDFFAAILRIDVDQRPGSLMPNPHPSLHPGTYAIPPDNPFIGATSWHGQSLDPATVRTEIWATGLRNPFRFSFDEPTGRLFCGDVGQAAFEEVNIIRKGDDCGWSWKEGRANFGAGPVPRTPPAGAFSPADPIYDYGRAGTVSGKSITGGVVYRGRLFPELVGDYLFSDYVSGVIVALRETEGVWTPRVIAFNAGITGFGHHPITGEAIFCDMQRGQVKRLAYKTDGSTAPATLSATGAFANVAQLTPAAGVVPYEVNAPFWSDGAIKSRWFALRSPTAAFGYQKDGRWALPTGAVWIKHFDIETTPGDAATRRRLETRFLVKTASDVYGLTYRWREDQREADLVPMAGLDYAIPGANPPQLWRFPSRTECLVCHNHQAGHALSFHTAQLNRSGPIGASQLHELARAGYLNVRTLEPSGMLPALASLHDTQHSIDSRARSYLSANCAPCHQLGSSSMPSSFDARHQVPLEMTGLVNGMPTDSGGDPDHRLIVPGDPAHSVLLHRMAGTGGFSRMPPLGSNRVDVEGMALLTNWIQSGFTSSIAITEQPADVNARETGVAVFQVQAQGSGTVRYQWRKNRVPMPGKTDPVLVVNPVTTSDVAGYDVVVSDDLGSLVSSAALLRIVIQTPSVTNGPPPAESAICTPFFWPLSANEPTAVFTVRGLPRGLRYDPVQKAIVGLLNVPGPYTITIIPSTVAGAGEPSVFTFTLRPLPLGGGAGAMGAALLEKSPTFTQSMGGRIQITITPTGAVSGVLALGPGGWGFRGQVTISTAGVISLNTLVARRGLSTLSLALTIDATTRTFAGSLNDGPSSLPISGHLFHDVASVTLAQRDAMPARALSTWLSLTSADVGNAAVPQGVGTARFAGTKTLMIGAAGRLADGSAFTLGLSALDPHLTTYLPLYAGKGSLWGRLAESPIHAVTLSARVPVMGALEWIKTGPMNSLDRAYVPNGFSVKLQTRGSLDEVPVAGINRLGSADAPGNAYLSFTQGGLEPFSMNQALRLDALGRVTLTPGAGSVPLVFAVNHRTGEFSGSFRLIQGSEIRAATLRGLILPDAVNPGRWVGRGHFTLPGLPAATSPILSGAVELRASE